MIDEENRMVGGTGDGLLPRIYKVHGKNGHQDTHIKAKNARRCFFLRPRTLQHRLVPGQEHGLRARGRGGGAGQLRG
jgi:hypothetical protein